MVSLRSTTGYGLNSLRENDCRMPDSCLPQGCDGARLLNCVETKGLGPRAREGAGTLSQARIRHRQFEQCLPQHLALGIGPQRVPQHAAQDEIQPIEIRQLVAVHGFDSQR